MFTKGFTKVAFLASVGKAIKGAFTGPASAAGASSIGNAVKSPTVKALRRDGSKVTSDWGVKQGLRSNSISYADVK